MTKLDEGLEKRHCLCNMGKGDKEERKMGKGMTTTDLSFQSSCSMFMKQRCFQKVNLNVTQQSNKKANRENNCDNTIVTSEANTHRHASVSGPDDYFYIKEVNTTHQGVLTK